MDANDAGSQKSSVEEIRRRFDADVERFSNLETGQTATLDAPLVLELIAQASQAATPHATSLLDIGCGAGNYSLKLLEVLPLQHITLVDLSQPMLDRATQRLSSQTSASINCHQADIRELPLAAESFDVVVAAAVLHHLREEAEWRQVFANIYQSLRPGGCFWISDLVQHSQPALQAMFWQRYGEYLTHLGGTEYAAKVFAYVAKEDSPRPLLFQLDLLRSVGFQDLEILHKHGCFAAFGAVKSHRRL